MRDSGRSCSWPKEYDVVYNAKLNAVKDTKKVKNRLLPVPCLCSSPCLLRNNWERPELTLAGLLSLLSCLLQALLTRHWEITECQSLGVPQGHLGAVAWVEAAFSFRIAGLLLLDASPLLL